MTTIANTTVATPGGKWSTSSIASFARPANVTAYGAGDSFSDSDETAKAILFPDCGRSGILRRARLVHGETDAAAAFTLLLFDAEPTGQLDNAASALVAADIPKLIGRFDFAQLSKLTVGTDIDAYRATLDYDALGGAPYSSADGNLYGLLVVTAGYTPASASTMHLRLQVEQDH